MSSSSINTQSKLLGLPIEVAKMIIDLATVPEDVFAPNTVATPSEPAQAKDFDFVNVMSPLRASRDLYFLGKAAYFDVREWQVTMCATHEASQSIWPWHHVTSTYDNKVHVYAQSPLHEYEVLKSEHRHIQIELTVGSPRCLEVALGEVAKLGQDKAVIFEKLDCADEHAQIIRQRLDNGCSRQKSRMLRLSVKMADPEETEASEEDVPAANDWHECSSEDIPATVPWAWSSDAAEEQAGLEDFSELKKQLPSFS